MARSEGADGHVTALALAAGRGDRNALAAFVEQTQREVWRFVAHLAGVAQADDLAQETFLRAIVSLPGFAGRSSARIWLLSIARRVAVDQIRTAVRRPRISQVDFVDAADRAVDRTRAGYEELVELNLLLEALDPDRRAALILTQVLGLSYAETAEVSGCAIGTIRSRVARAREELIAAREGERGAGIG